MTVRDCCCKLDGVTKIRHNIVLGGQVKNQIVLRRVTEIGLFSVTCAVPR